MQTDTRQLNDEQRQAVEYLLSVSNGCGLHKLCVEELVALCQRLGAALDAAERQGYNTGYSRALADNREYQSAIIESKNLKRAHS